MWWTKNHLEQRLLMINQRNFLIEIGKRLPEEDTLYILSIIAGFPPWKVKAQMLSHSGEFRYANCNASIAFGYPQRIFGVNPKPPRPRKCYNFLKSVQLPLTGWWTLCYLEFAENLCTAPLQLNTQHNRYFTLPVGRTAWSRQTITHGGGESIMILLLPHASDGVTEFGL